MDIKAFGNQRSALSSHEEMRIFLIVFGIGAMLGLGLWIAWHRSHSNFKAELQRIRSMAAEIPLGSDPKVAKEFFDRSYMESTFVDGKGDSTFLQVEGAWAEYVGWEKRRFFWTPSMVGCGSGVQFRTVLKYDSNYKLVSREVKPSWTCF